MGTKSLLLGIFVVLSMISCKSKQDADENKSPDYNPYVEAFTAGDISVKSNIVVQLSEAPKFDSNEKISETAKKWFDISPSVKGEVHLLDNKTAAFIPDEGLKVNQKYTVVFHVDRALENVNKQYGKFEFGFSTIKPSFYMVRDGLKLYNETSPHLFKLVRDIHVSDYAEPADVEKMLTVKSTEKSGSVKWEHEGKRHTFIIDSIKAGESPSEIKLSLNAKTIGGDLTDEETLRVPSKYEFDILDVKMNFEDNEQVIVCRFSAPIDTKQSLTGIVTLEDRKFTYRVSLNTIILYPTEKLKGQITLTIFGSLKSANGGKFDKTYTEDLVFESDKPEVKFLNKGSILPSSNNGTVLPFQAVSLSSVTAKIIKIYENNVLQFLQVNNFNGQSELKRAGRLVAVKTIRLDESKTEKELRRWNTYALDLSKLITPEQGAIYRVELSFTRQQAITDCEPGEEDAEDAESANVSSLTDEELFKQLETTYDDESYYDYYGSYYYDDDDEYHNSQDPCSSSYYSRNQCRVVKNILASDFGIIAKMGTNNSIRFIVTNVQQITPLAAVNLEVYNYQQQLIGKGVTNAEGFADVEVKGKPFIAVAKQGAQRGYLKMQDGLAISLSRFDVAGDAIKNGIKGFIYGERGVWRPGDSIFLTFILQNPEGALPASHPVILEITNARGQVVAKQSKVEGVNGFYTFAYQTSEDAPTGNWLATVKVGGVSFTKYLKVETVKPNRLKINLKFKQDELDLYSPIEGTLSSAWLHGAVAKNLKTEISMYLSKTQTTFKGYENYVFDDPTKEFETEQKTFFSGNLDSEGNVTFAGTVSLGSKPAGKLKADFITRVFEESGDFSIDKVSKEVFPYKKYVGIVQPKGTGYGNMLETDKDQLFNIVVLNKSGKLADKADLNISVYKLGWSWWWSSSDNQLANFDHSSYSTPVHSETIKASGGRAVFPYKASHGQYGFYLIKVEDKSGEHSTGTVAYYDWPGWGGRARQGSEGATILTFESDKASYNVGESAIIKFSSSNAAKALISIENGTKALNTYWVNCTEGETKIEVKTTPEMTPNVYVSITLVQPHAQTQNDLPIRLFGVIPVNVVDPETIITPEIDAPAEIRPEESYKITVKEAKGVPMTYTLAVVDEGLLDLTKFKTPDPWRYFYAKEALGVNTWDMYESLIGAYGGRIEQLFAIGGGDAALANRTKVNRFKPVVNFIGPFFLGKDKRNTHTLSMPNYVGSVKVMVVAGNKKGYGNADKTIPVKKPLMTLATLPRVLGPGEEIDMPVTVFSMDEKITKVSVSLETNDMFTVEENQRSVSFSGVGDEMTSFKLKVKEKTGAGKIKVIATANNERSEYEVELEVRTPNPSITKVQSVILEAGKKASVSGDLPGMEGTNTGKIEVSFIPHISLGRRLNYLIQYPHGCLEQTTSTAFPQLYLGTVIDLSAKDKTDASYYVKAALNKLKDFVSHEGGFSYWPGESSCNTWATSYAGDFMLEAERKGFALPSGLKQGWVKFQQKKARAWVKNVHNNDNYSYAQNDFDQAYRLYTLAKAKSPELGAMNRLKEDRTITLQARWVLAAAYAIAGQSEIATKLIETAETNVSEYSSFSQTYGSNVRDMAMILDALILVKQDTRAFEMVRNLAQQLNSDKWMSTQTTAYALMGISRYAENLKDNKTIELEYVLNGKSQNISSKKSLYLSDLGKLSNGKIDMENKSKNTVYVQVSTTGIPLAGQETASENKIKLAVSYYNANNTVLDPSKLTQGTDFYAVVNVMNNTNAFKEEYYNIALTQIFPSGWEIMNDRLLGLESAKYGGSSNYDYCDIRDDRVYTYFELDWLGNKKFIVKLNAAYTGRFYLPAFKVEAMYDGSISANSAGQWVEVVK
ncbi:MAG: hypothetical protein LBR10_02970 [Prevotellaceae bacterium]|jgi:uncharacterized protein YfaS (alpha-2-macroglobulin family)|nr:hypothetical protein [Prevotellaceae bacterium]